MFSELNFPFGAVDLRILPTRTWGKIICLQYHCHVLGDIIASYIKCIFPGRANFLILTNYSNSSPGHWFLGMLFLKAVYLGSRQDGSRIKQIEYEFILSHFKVRRLACYFAFLFVSLFEQ